MNRDQSTDKQDQSQDKLRQSADRPGESRDNQEPVLDRLTVPEAAELLGLTQDAVRKRIRRDQIQWEKDTEGRVHVFLDQTEINQDQSETQATDQARDEFIDELRERIRLLERELEDWKDESRRKDAVMMQMARALPELEAATEPRESAVSNSEDISKGGVPQEPTGDEFRQSWWRRWFGG